MPKFKPGNSGRPPGAVGKKNRPLAQLCREIVEGDAEVCRDLNQKGLLELVVSQAYGLKSTALAVKVKLDLLEVLLAYGYGKPPVKVVLGEEDESPDGVLRRQMRERNERLKRESEGGNGSGEPTAQT